ncbi:MAG: TIGR04283 family arsenosugar biosynthesis glycosyltransferase [Chloroflexota bacterium]
MALAVSVVVIALNEAETIAACLDHVTSLIQADGPAELIVSDGGSSDGTAELAGRYGLVVSAPLGRAHGLNAGAARATGDVLLFLHADTRLPARALTAVRRALADQHVVGGRFRLSFDRVTLALRLTQMWINLRDGLLGGYTGDQAMFVRRAVFQKLSGYAPLPLMEDLDFARRLGQSGRVVRLRESVVTSARRWQRLGLVRTNLRMIALRWLYYVGVPPSVLAPHYHDTR